MNKRAMTVFLLFWGMGFTVFILIHLIQIWMHGAVVICESNPIILAQEIITLSIVILLYIRELRQ